ncbi:glutaminyl-tRNA synthase (glutamine-hydrolyzing) subunit A [candidate division Kazan bacterium RIFCSPHIGHO2_01_FULL_49_10]|uniref:Glutamyl-tRNA(Gln) amidotransferase subunit A n=1 Tax=candidate division Kazan bacterium RIFCSPLOWO2_01_FULL_48_13 TaxID=1798539 RepID=A0A1F4PPN9_UNCK3|nr:MAG: glutaminyl-tRNA synthase (glutamine-hydrolyzing) subunit A [candidate division Kazan bacterium RIFCSPHIGHO2_01_FULL_49_10]OGB85550.1 MAG: glutaminyl-tRNA synthase (glutamine-hydrolyzing) subunit A [candidate division Kazan bacterium RIFCSPLOWO2_01_FULL_48_13]
MNIEEAKKVDLKKFLIDVQSAHEKFNILLSIAERPGKLGKGDLAVPCLIKDNIVTIEYPTTCASKILAGFESPYEATVITKLKQAGAWVAGKLNLDEFAMGSSTENSAFGATKNPVDPTRVPGGSSGGSAAAVAAGVTPFSLGSDTGGSIRQPAAFCGVVGMKPTYGRVSRYGLVAMASSLDQIGPITNTVEDCALVLKVISGHDPLDATSLDVPVPDYVAEMKQDIKGLTVGVPKEFFGDGVDKGVIEKVREAIKQLEKSGAKIKEVSLPNSRYALATYYIIQPAEVSANLARFDGVKYGASEGTDENIETIEEMYRKTRAKYLGDEVKRRIMLGTYATSAGFRDAYYDRARKVATLIKQDFDHAFKEVDVLITPTTPTTAFKLGENSTDPLKMYMSDLLTVPANIAGIPAISIPCGQVDNLPVGLQIMGPQLGESKVLQIAYAYEQSTDWRQL